MRRSRKSSPLPLRNGVSPHSVFLPAGAWPTVLAFLCERFPTVPCHDWQQRMSRGDVVDADGHPIPPSQAFMPLTRIHYYRTVEQEIQIPFEEVILFEDEHFLVVDKPHFLPTQPSGPFLQETLVARLRRRLAHDALEPLHRLDRETAGLVLVSKNPASRAAYHALFREHRIEKTYQAIAPCNSQQRWPLVYRSRIEVDGDFFRRCEKEGAPNSETTIDLLQQQGDWGLYQLQPRTGKTHQLRIHMAALGIPICNDPLYPVDRKRRLDDFSAPLQLLAHSLIFTDPVSGRHHQFYSDLRLEWPRDA